MPMNPIDPDGVDDSEMTLVCLRVDATVRSEVMAASTVGRCDNCDEQIWISASAPTTGWRICMSCAPVLMASGDDPVGFLAPTPAQRAALLETGFTEASLAHIHGIVATALEVIALARRREAGQADE